MDRVTRGRFIALEGGEGMGKSTQARLLVEALERQGIAVLATREPGGTPGAEAIRTLLLDPPGEGWGPRAEALLFAAARSDHVERLIQPALAAGTWVVCDRFVDSSRAYQGIAGGLGDDVVRTLHEHGSGGLRPDLAIVIVAPGDVARERLTRRDGENSDAIGGRDGAYHARVNASFADLAAGDPGAFALVDGARAVGQVHADVMRAVAPLIAGAA